MRNALFGFLQSLGNGLQTECNKNRVSHNRVKERAETICVRYTFLMLVSWMSVNDGVDTAETAA